MKKLLLVRPTHHSCLSVKEVLVEIMNDLVVLNQVIISLLINKINIPIAQRITHRCTDVRLYCVHI